MRSITFPVVLIASLAAGSSVGADPGTGGSATAVDRKDRSASLTSVVSSDAMSNELARFALNRVGSDTVGWIFALDPDQQAEKVGAEEVRSALHELADPLTSVELVVDGNGDGHLVANGTDAALCQIRGGAFTTCYLKVRFHNYALSCEKKEFWTGELRRFLVCRQPVLRGTGIGGTAEMVFLLDENFSYLGHLPKEEYISGWGIPGTLTFEAQSDFRVANDEVLIERSVTIAFGSGGADSIERETRKSETYRIDFAQRRIVSLKGTNGLGVFLQEQYKADAKELCASFCE